MKLVASYQGLTLALPLHYHLSEENKMKFAERIEKISNLGSDEMAVEFYLVTMPKRIDQSTVAARSMDWMWAEILDCAYPTTVDTAPAAQAAYEAEVCNVRI